MNVAFLIYSLEKAGGSERVTVNIANRLQSLGYRVSVITLEGQTSFFQLADGITYYKFDHENSRLKKANSLIRFFNDKNFDFIIAVSIGKLSLYLAALSFFFKNKSKLIASEHLAFSQASKLTLTLKKYFYQKFVKVVVLTDSDLKLLRSYNLKNIIKIANASSYFPALKAIEPVLNRSKIILAAGRLEYQKGFDLLIRAWSAIYKDFPEWQLKIIGEGSQKAYLQQLINTNITEVTACELISFTTHMQDYYNNAQVFALSSRFEGLPMVMIEALCYGCPLIAFNCETGPREIIVNEENGFLVLPENLNDFSNKLRQLLSSGVLREDFFKNHIQERERYSLDNVIKEWSKILE